MSKYSLIENRIALLVVRLDADGQPHFRRTLNNSEIAEGTGLTASDVAQFGRARGRLYFEEVDRQFCCEYARGLWTIYHRARYWRGAPKR